MPIEISRSGFSTLQMVFSLAVSGCNPLFSIIFSTEINLVEFFRNICMKHKKTGLMLELERVLPQICRTELLGVRRG